MKKTRKILPVSIYGLYGLENWLEQQAKAGLFPVFLNSWVTFTPTALPGTRFRLEPRERDADRPGPELLEKCREAGWDYALTVGTLYYLFYTTDPCASYTCFDGGARREYMAGLKRRSRRSALIGWALFLISATLGLWGALHFQSRFDVQPEPFAGLPLLLLNLFGPGVVLGDSGGLQRGRGRGQNIFPGAGRGLHLRPGPGYDLFHSAYPALAEPVARAQLDEYRLVNLRWSYRELNVPGLDFAILAEEPEGVWQMAALGKGGRVAVYRYAGTEKLEEHLELLASPLIDKD